MAEKNWNNTYGEHADALRILQLEELKLLHFLDEVCRKHSLRYYIAGGTLLGAVRHKGFIPWDDDTDVTMPRPDYEKLMQIIRSELPSDFDFLNYSLRDDYHRYFSRIVSHNVKIQNASNTKTIEEYAWLDIFPLDGMPNGKLRQQIRFWSMTAVRFFYHASCFEELVNLNRPGRPKYQQLAIWFLSKTHFGSKLDTKKILLFFDKHAKKYSYDSSPWLVCFFGGYLQKEIMPKEIYGAGTLYDFEDMQTIGPDNARWILERFYGDYMTPPSDANKDKHNILLIEHDSKN